MQENWSNIDQIRMRMSGFRPGPVKWWAGSSIRLAYARHVAGDCVRLAAVRLDSANQPMRMDPTARMLAWLETDPEMLRKHRFHGEVTALSGFRLGGALYGKNGENFLGAYTTRSRRRTNRIGADETPIMPEGCNTPGEQHLPGDIFNHPCAVKAVIRNNQVRTPT